MSKSNWIKELKVGDKVFTYAYGKKHLHTVERITPKGCIKVNGQFYTKKGILIGNGQYKNNFLIQATEESIIDYENNAFINAVTREMRKTPYNSLSFEKASKIAEILDFKPMTEKEK